MTVARKRQSFAAPPLSSVFLVWVFLFGLLEAHSWRCSGILWDARGEPGPAACEVSALPLRCLLASPLALPAAAPSPVSCGALGPAGLMLRAHLPLPVRALEGCSCRVIGRSLRQTRKGLRVVLCISWTVSDRGEGPFLASLLVSGAGWSPPSPCAPGPSLASPRSVCSALLPVWVGFCLVEFCEFLIWRPVLPAVWCVHTDYYLFVYTFGFSAPRIWLCLRLGDCKHLRYGPWA